MGIRPYIDDDLAAGRLVAPFALIGAEGHALVPGLPQFQAEQRDFAAFRRWIMRAARARRAGSAGERRRIAQKDPKNEKAL